jgi:CDP-diacylglycerol--glycerol-3-phosphate 3-phosphatidyltransferase
MVVYRLAVGRRGVSIPARASAKVKTLVQGVAILLALAPPVSSHQAVVSGFLWAAVGLTVVTGAQYLRDGRRAAKETARAAVP